jgi:hypothetical protein
VLAAAGTGHLGFMQGDYALLEVLAVSGLICFATFDAPLKRLEMDSASETKQPPPPAPEEVA